jgi:hypothetical protein
MRLETPTTPEERTSPTATFVPSTRPVVRTVVSSVMELTVGSIATLAIGPPEPLMPFWRAWDDAAANPKA